MVVGRVLELGSLGDYAGMRLILSIAIGALLVGCRTRSTRIAEQFAFLEVGMPMTVVSNRVGMPDLPYRGQIQWRYSLVDGSEIAVVAKAEREPYTFETWRVVWFGQSRDCKWIWIQPLEILK